MFSLPSLPYNYDALEPFIDKATMEIHHTKHHQAYIDKLNEALGKHQDLQGKPAEELLKDLNAIPEDIRTTIQNHAGGHANHSLFWQIMEPKDHGAPSDGLADALKKDLGGIDKFKEDFTNTALNRFGSGWAWLAYNGTGLRLLSTANQDSPISQGLTPLLCLDVWEHAYYLKYQNKRADYIAAWWNVVNWNKVNELFLAIAH